METITTHDGTPLQAIAPAEGSRDGWRYSSYLRVGSVRLPDTKRGGAVLYGLYGVRETVTGWELLLQREGTEDSGGGRRGLSLVSTSCDLEPYIWHPATPRMGVRVF